MAQSDEPWVINLGDMKKDMLLQKQRLALGDRVIFNGYVGVWSELELLTGVITHISNDSMWTFTVELDHPELLGDITAWNTTPSGGRSATVAGNGLVKLSDVEKNQPEFLPKLNDGLGIDIRPVCSKDSPCEDINPAFKLIVAKTDAARLAERQIDKILRKLEQKYVFDAPEYVSAKQAHNKAEKKHRQATKETVKDAQTAEYEASNQLHQVHTKVKTAALEQYPDYKAAQSEWFAANKAFMDSLNNQDEEIRKLLQKSLAYQHPDAQPIEEGRYDSHDLCYYILHECPHCHYKFSVPSRKKDTVTRDGNTEDA